jgi:putative ABC transport system substrate-binding protein
MRRREFVGFIGAVALLPRIASAQSNRTYRIAILHPSHSIAELTSASSFGYWREFFVELRRLGYVEGRNLLIERYSGEGRVEDYPKLARDVAARNSDLIFAITVWMVAPLKQATSTIPIVAMTSDPVDLGLVSSMARPGGNITGVSVDAGLEIWGKRLQLFREVVPTISKLGILALRRNPEGVAMRETAEKSRHQCRGPFFSR